MGGIFFRRPSAPRLEVILPQPRSGHLLPRAAAALPAVRGDGPLAAHRTRGARAPGRDGSGHAHGSRTRGSVLLPPAHRIRRKGEGAHVRRRPGPARASMSRASSPTSSSCTRLPGVVIECLPFQEFIRRHDREETLFLLNPPYCWCDGGIRAALRERRLRALGRPAPGSSRPIRAVAEPPPDGAGELRELRYRDDADDLQR